MYKNFKYGFNNKYIILAIIIFFKLIKKSNILKMIMAKVIYLSWNPHLKLLYSPENFYRKKN